VILDEVAPDDWMAAVARETNLSDTAFVIPETSPDADFGLRWFTKGAVEVDLCGHATLAAAHCLFEDGISDPVRFDSRSGILTVSRRSDGSLGMDFPAWPPGKIDTPSGLEDALGASVRWSGRSANDFLLAVLDDEQAIRKLTPDIAAVARIPADVVIVTASADATRAYDFVSRVFAPDLGLDEDPVTGSAHTVLAPFWTGRLGGTSLVGLQASRRSGLVGVELNGDRVIVSGQAVTVLDGVLTEAAHPATGRAR
jgi:PhzF family phenazine biosynthesis protein